MSESEKTRVVDSSRRHFIQSSTLAAGGMLASGLLRPPAVHAAGGDTLKVGLIGCGGRGTGAASQALKADTNVKLTALGDVFEDRLQICLRNLSKSPVGEKVDVPPERQFTGFDAYQQVIDSGVDVVLLATPPHFRPIHLQAAVDAGKHVFAEKPVAVDTPGVQAVLKTCEEAKRKNLSIVSGLCLRYLHSFRDCIGRIHDGQIGTVTTLQANDYRGTIWRKPREPDWTDMHFQMRNWYYFTWLSGDFNVEQHVHNLDLCVWIMGDRYPVKCIGMGGREVRRGPEFGNIYDHHGVTYEYADGARIYSNTRQMSGCKNNISVDAVGTRGKAELRESHNKTQILSENPWRYEGEENNLYQTEHDELFASIRSGQPINNGDYMAKSTLLGIMGRMATYTGQEITWEMASTSTENLSPKVYAWGDAPAAPVAVPGVTKFV